MDDSLQCMLGCLGVANLTLAGVTTITAVQILAYLIKKNFPDWYRGFRRLGFIYLGTVTLGVVVFMVSGVDWKTAVVQANLLAYAQVFGHQVFKNLKEYGK